jgi:RNA polymerase sigma factor (sigma-70 family)
VFAHVLKDTPKLSPEEVRALVQQLHKGEASARDRLAGSQYRLIFSVAQKFAGSIRRPERTEDFFQDGVAALVQALDRFDPSRGALSTFTVTGAQRAMWRFFREDSVERAEDVLETRKRASRKRNACSDSGVSAAELQSDAVSYLARTSDPEAQLVARLLALLPDDEAMILEGHVNGMTQEEMAESFGVSDRTVRRKLTSATEKLRAHAQRFEEYAATVA